MGVLARAELLLQAKNYSGAGDWLDEANSHDAQFGSLAGADTNDPLFLAHTGTQHMYINGFLANRASTPTAAPIELVDDIDIQVKVAMTDWTPGVNQTLVGKDTGAPAGCAYRFRMKTTGVLNLVWNKSGSYEVNASTVATGLTDGTVKWVRVTRDAGLGEVKFYTSDDGITWTQLGATVAGTAGALTNSATPLVIGGHVSDPTKGDFYRVRIYSDLTETTLVFDADFTDINALKEPFATFTENSSNGATVTINRAATGIKSTVVDSARMLRGTDDYHEIPDDPNLDIGVSDDFTLMTVARSYDVTPAADQVLIAKKADLTTTAGYVLYIDTTGVPNFVIDDGTNPPAEASGPALTDGQSHVIAAVRNTTNDDITVFVDGVAGTPVTDSTVLTLANAEVVRLGASSAAAADFIDGEDAADVVWREALTDADVVVAGDELNGIFAEAVTRRVIRSPRYGITRMATR